jgi:hypothetical protein
MAAGIRALALVAGVSMQLSGAALADDMAQHDMTGHGMAQHDMTPDVGAAHGAHGRASDHAPIGVMGEHPHAAGEFMLSYRYMFMSMKGNRDGT